MDLLILSEQPRTVDQAALSARSIIVSEILGSMTDVIDAIASAAPDIALIEDSGDSDVLLQNLAQLQNLLPQCIIVPVKVQPTPDFLVQLMHLGIPDVLLDISTTSIMDLLDRIDARQTLRSKGTRKVTQSLAFMSAKGGTGASLIASNLSLALARVAPAQRVLLIDAALPFGDADIFLNAAKAEHHLGDFHESIDRLDAALFSALVSKIHANLDFIPSPPSFQAMMDMDAQRLSRLIAKAKLFYDFVLVDISSRLNPFSAAILENVEKIHLIATPDILGARHSVQLFRLFEELELPAEKILLCLNQQTTNNPLTDRSFTETVGKNLAKTIPSDNAAVGKSMYLGKPVMDVAPKSQFARAINDWALDLCGLKQTRISRWKRLKGS
jgi:pilus assembly protein CpaE